MIAALLLATAAPAATVAPPPQTAIEAERAFAADAQKLGQWTAFRKWSTPDALMFTPQPVKAHEFLKDRKDPPVAVFWWPGKSYVSCDGDYAINTGPWVREWGKSIGYFTTVWKRQADGGWKWIYDAGDSLKEPRAQGGDIAPRIASCEGPPRPAPIVNVGETSKVNSGQSGDGTVSWRSRVGRSGERTLDVWVWNGVRMERVILDVVGPPPK